MDAVILRYVGAIFTSGMVVGGLVVAGASMYSSQTFMGFRARLTGSADRHRE
jgi:hypothetical protein